MAPLPTPTNSPSASRADASTAPLVFFFCCAVAWLLVASAAGLTASIKLHEPDWLVQQAWLHLRPHPHPAPQRRRLRLGADGRPGHCAVRHPAPAQDAAARRALCLRRRGVVERRADRRAGQWPRASMTGWNGWRFLADRHPVRGRRALIGLPLVFTLVNRRVEHLYVSVWYMAARCSGCRCCSSSPSFPGAHQGVQQAAMNWWFGHNVLGLFYTPLALASVYYFPQGDRPADESYNLAARLLGLAFFYGPCRRPPPDRRAGAGVDGHAVHRAEHDDDHPGGRVHGEPVPDAARLPAALRWSPTLRFIGGAA